MLVAVVTQMIMVLQIIKWVSLTLTAILWMLPLVNEEYPYYIAVFPLVALLSMYLISLLKKI